MFGMAHRDGDVQTSHAVHSLDVLSTNLCQFIVLGYVEGKIEVWRVQETASDNERSNPPSHTLKLVPGDDLQSEHVIGGGAMDPVCVKGRSDGMCRRCSSFLLHRGV